MKWDRHLLWKQRRQPKLSKTKSEKKMIIPFVTSENIIYFHCVKISYILFIQLYSYFTACDKIVNIIFEGTPVIL